MTVRLLKTIRINGVEQTLGTIVTLAAEKEQEFVTYGLAEYYLTTAAQPGAQQFVNGAARVISEAEREGTPTADEVLNPTTTVVTKLFPSGLLALSLSYRDLGSAVGKEVYFVFDALDANDAATRLGAAGRFRLGIGAAQKDYVFSPSAKVYRLDIASNVASETGASVLAIEGKVQA